jgi:AmmeMemoRadiSam system protein A
VELNDAERRELLQIARESVRRAVLGEELPEPTTSSQRLLQFRGAFVTLLKDGQLRGCIGYTEAVKPLIQVVSEVAAKSAVDDPRFPPVDPEELDEIELEISVLSSMTKISDPNEIQVGKHGLLLENGYFRGLLLPQVAVEYHWDRNAFLENTARKAGLPPSAWKDPNTTLYTFSAEIIHERDYLE